MLSRQLYLHTRCLSSSARQQLVTQLQGELKDVQVCFSLLFIILITINKSYFRMQEHISMRDLSWESKGWKLRLTEAINLYSIFVQTIILV